MTGAMRLWLCPKDTPRFIGPLPVSCCSGCEEHKANLFPFQRLDAQCQGVSRGFSSEASLGPVSPFLMGGTSHIGLGLLMASFPLPFHRPCLQK